MMNRVWPGMVLAALVFGLLTGRMAEVAAAVTEGANMAVSLCMTILGTMCLWRGLMEVMRASGLAALLARGLRPALRRVFGRDAENDAAMEAISANVSANLLGLANAATPFGIEAAKRLDDRSGTASDGLCTLVVINSASLQLIPATAAAIRSSLGCATPYDILPAVWLTSALSLAAGLAAARLLRRLFPARR